MVWVEAVVDAAEVVEFEAVEDRADQEFVDKAMPGPALPVHSCPDVSVFGRGVLPDPASDMVDGDAVLKPCHKVKRSGSLHWSLLSGHNR